MDDHLTSIVKKPTSIVGHLTHKVDDLTVIVTRMTSIVTRMTSIVKILTYMANPTANSQKLTANELLSLIKRNFKLFIILHLLFKVIYIIYFKVTEKGQQHTISFSLKNNMAFVYFSSFAVHPNF